jgi:hypothetical protein
MLIACGKQFVDWTAAYQLFWGTRMNVDKLFEVASKKCLELLEPDQMLVAHMDDTIIRKRGSKIFGTSWRRDPLGPAFHTNFVWAQRFIQISLSLPGSQLNSQSRAIPIDFHHSPSVKKLPKKASQEDAKLHKEAKKQQNLSKEGSKRIKLFRKRLDEQGAKGRELYISVDGSYTNETIIKNLPKNVTLIGRIRKDAKLNHLPDTEKTKGRNKVYGQEAQTPEQVRQNADIPYQEVEGFAAGKVHKFKVKIIKSLKWRKAGKNHLLQMVVIAPLGYRLKNGSKLLYRQPAYLICTDNELSIEKLLQAYLWRWEIEVNFRDEKTVGGCGQAQVRNEIAAAKLPAFVVVIHAFIHLAECILSKNNLNIALPKAKWEKPIEVKRQSTNNLLNLFRGNIWYENVRESFSDFVKNQHIVAKAEKVCNSYQDAVYYTRR